MWRLGLQLVVLCDSVHELSMEDIGPFLKDYKQKLAFTWVIIFKIDWFKIFFQSTN